MLGGDGLLNFLFLFFINSLASPHNRVLFDTKVLLVGSPSGVKGPRWVLFSGGVLALGFDPRATELITSFPKESTSFS